MCKLRLSQVSRTILPSVDRGAKTSSEPSYFAWTKLSVSRFLRARSLTSAYSLLWIWLLLVIRAQIGNGIALPEEAHFADYSTIINAAAHWRQLNSSAALWNMWSIAFPWGILDLILRFMGFQVGSILVIHLFLRWTIPSLLMFHIARKRAGDWLGLLAVVLVMTSLAITSTLTFAAQWAQLVLLLFLVSVVQSAQVELTKWRPRVLYGVISGTLAIAMWSNIPTAVVTLALMVIFYLYGRVSLDRRSERFARLRWIFWAACAVSLIPITVFGTNSKFFFRVDSTKLFSAGNSGVVEVIQGFGKWSQDLGACVGIFCYKYEPTASTLLSPGRQILRVGIIVFSAVLLVVFSLVRGTRKKTATSIMLVSWIVLLGLSYVGHLSAYEAIRLKYPTILGIWREPWAKFSQPMMISVFLILICAAQILRDRFNQRQMVIIPIAITVSVIYLSAPLIQSAQNVPGIPRLTFSEWNAASSELDQLRQLPGDLCVVDVSNRRDLVAAATVVLLDRVTDRRLARPFWISDSLNQLGIKVDKSPNCSVESDLRKLLIVNSRDNWEGSPITKIRQAPREDCIVTAGTYFYVVATSCHVSVHEDYVHLSIES